MYGHYKPTDLECVNICTVCIVPFSDCPVLLVSNLQTDTSLGYGGRHNINGSLLQIIVSHYQHLEFTW